MIKKYKTTNLYTSMMVLIALLLLTFLTACSNEFKSTDVIQLWHYDEDIKGSYSLGIDAILENIKIYCTNNNIPIEFYIYNSDTLSRADYILKRNLAASFGNMITIDDVSLLEGLEKQYADYNKLNVYDKLFSGYKNRYCIPIGTSNSAKQINNEILEYYDIKTSKTLITYTDFLKIKQEMKQKGARFRLNAIELIRLKDYYLFKNDLLFLDKQNELLNDVNTFKEKLKKTVLDICKDIILYYDNSLKLNNSGSTLESIASDQILDKSSNLVLEEGIVNTISEIINPNSYPKELKYNSNKTFFIGFNYKPYMPNFFMHNKITNEKIYDLANYILSDQMYTITSRRGSSYAPSFKIDKSEEYLKINDNLDYIGSYRENEKIKESIETFYKMLILDEEKSKEIADCYYYSISNYNTINSFIDKTVYSIAYELSGEEHSLASFDPNDKKINKMIDDKINEFVLNFTLHNN